MGVEGALNHGDGNELQGHVASFQLVDDVVCKEMPLRQIPVDCFSVHRSAFVGWLYEVHVIERMEPEIVVGVLAVVGLIIAAFLVIGNRNFLGRRDSEAVQHDGGVGCDLRIRFRSFGYFLFRRFALRGTCGGGASRKLRCQDGGTEREEQASRFHSRHQCCQGSLLLQFLPDYRIFHCIHVRHAP